MSTFLGNVFCFVGGTISGVMGYRHYQYYKGPIVLYPSGLEQIEYPLTTFINQFSKGYAISPVTQEMIEKSHQENYYENIAIDHMPCRESYIFEHFRILGMAKKFDEQKTSSNSSAV